MFSHRPRTGGEILVDQLVAQGVTHATCVPGESYLAALDAMIGSGIDLMVCRNEGGAAMMAEAAGKLTGRPGICFVTRGPGATNASHGIHIAQQDSTPMIMFVGQVARDTTHREGFQEVDYRAFFGSMTKWVVEIDRADRIPELVARAFRVAMQGRPGPVVVALPEDMLTECATVPDAPYVAPADIGITEQDREKFIGMLANARSPLMVLGGSRWSEKARLDIMTFAERHDLPVATSFRRAHLFDASHPNYVGDLGFGLNPKLKQRVLDADTLLLVGGRMSEVPSASFELLDIPTPRQQLIHVHPGAEELGKIYQPSLAIQSTPDSFAAMAAGLPATGHESRKTILAPARASYIDWSANVPSTPGRFQLGDVMSWLSEKFGEDAIITNGAGNYSIWIHRMFRFRKFNSQIAPTSGSMGYGVPAAIMAKRIQPEKIVISFAGDGCFLMNGQELATAMQYDIPVIFVLVDNGILGTIRMHQEQRYPGRISATELRNPDFVEYAKSFGAFGERVETTKDFYPAFERALASKKPALLHCIMDSEALTPTRTLSEIREQGKQAASAN